MTTLFYTPGACSLSPNIALREAGIPFDMVRVDLRAKKLASGEDYLAICSKGYIPALRLDNGELLTEGAAMLQYIADLAPEKKLAPPAGSFERVRFQELLNYIATELHKGTSPFYSPFANEEFKTALRGRIKQRFAVAEEMLGGREFLFGDAFTVADGYLLYVLRGWQRLAGEPLSEGFVKYMERIAARPAVAAAIASETP
jgi:glutathione S-transferase